MKKLKITISAATKIDMEDIFSYTDIVWGRIQADKYTDEIAQKFDFLATNPHVGKKFDKYYYLRVKSHMVFYEFGENRIIITRILHIRADWTRHLFADG